jgi:hypothetical protein
MQYFSKAHTHSTIHKPVRKHEANVYVYKDTNIKYTVFMLLQISSQVNINNKLSGWVCSSVVECGPRTKL